MRKQLVIDARPLNHGHAGITRLLSDYLEHSSDDVQIYLLFQKVIVENIKIDLSRFHIIAERNSMFKFLPSSIWFAFFAFRLIPKTADWFWATNTLVPFFRNRKLKLLCTLHDFVHIDAPNTMTFANLMSFRLFFKKSLILADKIQTTTELAVQRINQISPALCEKCTVNQPGVSKEFADPHYLRETKIYDFLAVGTIEPRKNLDYTIYLVAELRKSIKFSEAKLLLIGKIGWNVPRNLMRKIETEHWIIHRYNLKQSDLIKSYYQSSNLILSSHDEGFGLPIIEAMAAGCNIICSDIPVLREVSGGKAIYLGFNTEKDARMVIEHDSKMFVKQKKKAFRTTREFAIDIEKEIFC